MVRGGKVREKELGAEGPGCETDSEGLLWKNIFSLFWGPFILLTLPLWLFSSASSTLSCAVHSSSRDSVLMSLGTPPVLDRARMEWLTAAISTAREMGSWCSLCAALSSYDKFQQVQDVKWQQLQHMKNKKWISFFIEAHIPSAFCFPAIFFQSCWPLAWIKMSHLSQKNLELLKKMWKYPK